MHISIIIPRGQYSIVNIAGAFQLLNAANELYAREHDSELFQVELIDVAGNANGSNAPFTVKGTASISERIKTDLIIVPAVHNDMDEVLSMNQELIAWLTAQYKNGTSVASFCIGAYLLAEAGILDQKPCSTHWVHASAFRERYPKVQLIADNIVTEVDGIFTSGGAYAFTNLLIYIIEKYGGRELAIVMAKTFMIDLSKSSQSPFIIFRGQKNHSDELVLDVQEFIENNFEQSYTIEELALRYNSVRRTLERRFKKHTGNTINEYLQRVRVEAAKKQLEVGRKTVSEVMFDVGYNDSKAFREVFRKYTGISPLDYKEKYGFLSRPISMMN